MTGHQDMRQTWRSDTRTASTVRRPSPRPLNSPLPGLQRAAGNRAVTSLVQTQLARTPIQPEEEHGSSAAHSVEHAQHKLHEAHLGAEAAEKAVHVVHHEHKIEEARELIRAHSRMEGQLRQMRKALRKLTNRLTKSGGGKKVARALAQTEAAYMKAAETFKADRGAVRAANEVVRASKVVAPGLAAKAQARLSRWVVVLDRTLASTQVGRLLRRVVAAAGSSYFEKGVRGLSAIAATVHGYLDSPARTQGGKAANATLEGMGDLAITASVPLSIADAFVPKAFKPSGVTRGAGAAIGSLGEGVATGQTRGMEEFHRRSLHGDYGMVMEGYSQIGELLADPPSLEEAWGGVTEAASELSDWVGDLF